MEQYLKSNNTFLENFHLFLNLKCVNWISWIWIVLINVCRKKDVDHLESLNGQDWLDCLIFFTYCRDRIFKFNRIILQTIWFLQKKSTLIHSIKSFRLNMIIKKLSQINNITKQNFWSDKLITDWRNVNLFVLNVNVCYYAGLQIQALNLFSFYFVELDTKGRNFGIVTVVCCDAACGYFVFL